LLSPGKIQEKKKTDHHLECFGTARRIPDEIVESDPAVAEQAFPLIVGWVGFGLAVLGLLLSVVAIVVLRSTSRSKVGPGKEPLLAVADESPYRPQQ